MEKRKPAEMNEVRNSFYVNIEDVAPEDHEFVGMSAEGAVFVNKEGNHAVVKVIAKAIDFDADAAIADFEARQKAAIEKEAAVAAKKAEKAEKARKRAEDKAAKEAKEAEAEEVAPE